MSKHSSLATLCIIVKYILTLIMFAISVFISKDVLDQYASKSTSFKQHEENVTKFESITFVLGFWPLKKMNYHGSIPYQSYNQWELEKDFFIHFGVTNFRNAQETIELKENVENLEILHSSIGQVRFNKLVTKYGNYYKISSNVIKVKSPYKAFVQVTFNENVKLEDIPSLDVKLSSEENSFGVTMSDWVDGKRISINKVQGFTWMELQPKKIIKMSSQSNCDDTSFYECFHSQLEEQKFEHCPKKCFSISTYGNATPICETVEEFACSHEITTKLKKQSKCLPVCIRTDYEMTYEYQEDVDTPNAKRNITIAYAMASSKMKVDEEYLVQDFVGMLGSIGGTLGLFVGFSFTGGVSFILDQLQIFWKDFLPQR